MSERYGRWIAALIMIALLLAVVLLYATVDLGLDEHIITDVGSAPILSGVEPDSTKQAPTLQPEDSSPPEPPPKPGD